MEYLWFPLFVASVLAYIAFRQWLRHQQRVMVHRERLAALEKGADLPAWPDEAPSRFDFGMDSLLLLSGLIWLAIGLGGMLAAFVIVGHPQVQRIPDAVPALTVLYAPTWEGWGDDPYATSLALLGPALVGALLARPGLRVMYRPHPRSGHRDRAVRAAHDTVVGLLRAAGASAAASTSPRDTSISRSSTSVTASPAPAEGCAPSMVTMCRISASVPAGCTTTRWPGRAWPLATVPE